jgi:hypothetical protein
MIKFVFKTEKGKREALIPENWAEVKVKHLKKLEEQQPHYNYEALACFTDETVKEFANGTSKQDFLAIASHLGFLSEKPEWNKIKKKDLIQLGPKKIKPPKQLQLKRIGQKMTAMRIIQKYATEQKEPSMDDVIEILAIYLQPEYTGHFDTDKLEGIKHHIMEMPCIVAMPWFLFFFKRLQGLKAFGLIDLRLSLGTLKNLIFMSRQAAQS